MSKRTTSSQSSPPPPPPPPPRAPSFNQSLSPPAQSTSTLQKLLGPLPGNGTNPSKVHCASDDALNRSEKNTTTSTSTSATPWFNRVFSKRFQDQKVTHMKPCDERPSIRTSDSSSSLPSSNRTRRGSIPSIRRALSHRSSSSTSHITRRDSLELYYKQSDKYRPAIPHPLMEMAGGFESVADTDEHGDSFKMPSSLVAERSRRGAQA